MARVRAGSPGALQASPAVPLLPQLRTYDTNSILTGQRIDRGSSPRRAAAGGRARRRRAALHATGIELPQSERFAGLIDEFGAVVGRSPSDESVGKARALG